MKIVVTGASGFVGRNLIPELLLAGVQIMVVGRQPSHLHELFPTCEVTSYDDLEKNCQGYDVVLHLAVANTNSELTVEEIFKVNAEWPLEIARIARNAGVARFINISSVHALDDTNMSAYAMSKRQGEIALRALQGLQVDNLYLANVYGSQYSGKLSFLNHLPKWLSGLLFAVFSAILPTVNVKIINSYLLKLLSTDKISKMNGFLHIISDDKNSNFIYTIARRVIDLSFCIFILIFLNWLFILIWIAVRAESTGPGIFSQRRVGKNGKFFTCYKFRTMSEGTIQAGTHEVSANSVTKVGHFLRRTKLDELPQIWNLLRNEMTLIGPRPCLPVQEHLINLRMQQGILDITPGITGLAQVNGIDMSDAVMLTRWDLRYKALRGLVLDLKIIIATIIGRGQGDKTQKHAS